jgi:2-polyprenyl-3-methyl-5-hydroxy-6-metoxy-1,4-benzoquinol methylase
MTQANVQASGAPEPSTDVRRCVVCGAENALARVRTAVVHSNVKPFARETFSVWQCAACASIHARDEVDLDHYYAQYPFHGQTMSLPSRFAFRNQLKRLVTLGLSREHRVLDYGCGSGLFVQYMVEQGYVHARGYDAYASSGPYAEPPGGGFHFVHSQDVIEHVADPRVFLQTLSDLALPGALLAIGTPDAGLIDLSTPQAFVHMLHQPYHRHILSKTALLKLAESMNLTVHDVQHGFPGNTAFPGLNSRFLGRMLKAHGDTLDDTLRGKMPWKWELFTPAALWDALTGSRRDPGFDMTVALRVADAR